MKAHDIIDRTARLFSVSDEMVNSDMIQHVRITQVMLSPPPMPKWHDCPRCAQSATAKYDGKFACTRCKWTEGQG